MRAHNAAVKSCDRTGPSGQPCGNPAMRSSRYCYQHGRATAPAARKSKDMPIDLPVLVTPIARMTALNLIVQSVAGNRISDRRARTLLHAVAMAMQAEQR